MRESGKQAGGVGSGVAAASGSPRPRGALRVGVAVVMMRDAADGKRGFSRMAFAALPACRTALHCLALLWDPFPPLSSVPACAGME